MNNIPSRTVIATGIPGCGRKDYLKKWETYARDRGKHIKVFLVGEMMFRHAREAGLHLNDINILNCDRDYLDILRSAVFNKILAIILKQAEACETVIICNHAFFYWQRHYSAAFDRFVKQFAPSLYVTFIDNHAKVLGRLNQRRQWQGQDLNEEKILEWQGIEVESTSKFADMEKKPFFAVPTNSSPSLFHKLVFHPSVEPVYLAMPISHFTDPKDRKQIDRFAEKLDQYFAVFNPLSMESVGAVKIGGSAAGIIGQEAVYRHIIYRDLEWFVRRAGKIVVFWPQRPLPKEIGADRKLSRLWPRVIPSPGVDHETHAGFSKTKDVWLVCLSKEVSPFTTHFCTKFFTSVKDFFDFLAKRYPDRVNAAW